MKAGGKSQKQKIINSYMDLRQAALEEVSIDIMRQTVAIMIYSLRLTGKYTDNELKEIFNHFTNIINLGEVMGKPLRTDEVTEYIIKELNLDIDSIQPKIGK